MNKTDTIKNGEKRLLWNFFWEVWSRLQLDLVAADFTKKLIGNQFKILLSLVVNYGPESIIKRRRAQRAEIFMT